MSDLAAPAGLDPKLVRRLTTLKTTIDGFIRQLEAVVQGTKTARLTSWDNILERYGSIMWALRTTIGRIEEQAAGTSVLSSQGLSLANIAVFPGEVNTNNREALPMLTCSQTAPTLRQRDEADLAVVESLGLPENPVEALDAIREDMRLLGRAVDHVVSHEAHHPRIHQGVLFLPTYQKQTASLVVPTRASGARANGHVGSLLEEVLTFDITARDQ
ncbi:unnamed protein product [Pedinophyceae sp. YPF-701]|nr:unnamed protein product [Pedinophyceae sp. YPF-701]